MLRLNELKHTATATIIIRSRVPLRRLYSFPDHTDAVGTSTLVCSVNKLNKAPSVRLSPCIVRYSPDSDGTGMALEFRATFQKMTFDATHFFCPLARIQLFNDVRLGTSIFARGRKE